MTDEGFIDRKIDNRRAKSNFSFVLAVAIIAIVMGVGGFFVGRIFSGWDGNILNLITFKTHSPSTSQQKKTNQKKINTPETVGAGKTAAEQIQQIQQIQQIPQIPRGEQKGGSAKNRAEEDEAKIKPGIIFLEPFTVNLNDPFGRRYAEVAVNLVIDDKIMVNKITENELMIPRVRDEIFMIISGKSYADLKSTSGKVTLKEEIMIRVNEILKDEFKREPVIQVLFTRFLIQ